jgi:hypothetical protein
VEPNTGAWGLNVSKDVVMDDEEVRKIYKELANAEVSRAKLIKDIQALASIINNGLTNDIIHIKEMLMALVPNIKDNTYWVGKWKQGIFWIAVMAVGGGGIATAFYLVRNFVG